MKIKSEYVEQIKSRVSISQLIQADVTLKRAGNLWTTCCPFHGEKTPSFFVYEGHFHCFGCGAHGDQITWLMRKRGSSFEEAVEILAGEKPPSSAQAFEDNIRSRAEEHSDVRRFGLTDEQRAKQAQARAIWRAASPFLGSVAETYLRLRKIRVGKWPPCLRFVDQAWHGWERTEHPALIGAIQDGTGHVTAIQTTFLSSEGRKAGLTPPKPVLGPMLDGAVRLGKPAKILGIAEGIETALSARQIYSLPVWATCGSGRLGAVKIPEGVNQIIVFGDNGDRGKEAAHKAVDSYFHQGYAAAVAFPDEGSKDFNESLQQQTAAA